MEQNCAVWITVLFIFVVMGLGLVISAGGKTGKSKESDHREK